jgi:hypothetical protein
MLIEAKSNLARLMATENLVVEERNVQTAFFDIKSRILTVPILNGNLSSYLYDLLLGHEVGHALETPAEGWHDSIIDLKVNKSILNVCEDVRIEKKIKRKFPGLKYSFNKGYEELMEMDFFGVKGKDLNELNFIDRINLHTKGGSAQGILFNDDENELLKEVESAETFTETVDVAKKIQQYMKEELEKKKEEQKQLNEEKKELKKVPGAGKLEEGKQSTSVQDFEDETYETVDEETDDTDTEKQEKKNTTTSKNSGQTKDISEEELTSETDDTFREKEKTLYTENNKKDIIYTDIPKINYKNVIISYNDIIKEFENVNRNYDNFKPEKLKQNFIKFKADSNKVVSYLVKEFEMRKNAEQQSRAKVSKTGDLNMNKIHEYRFTDDIFARLTKVPNGKSHGLIMFIDWSGSMADKINPTIRQLFNLALFCKKVNIPFEVYAFTTQWTINGLGKKIIQTPKVGELNVGYNFSLMNILSHKMNARDFSNMASFLLDFEYKMYGGRCENMCIPENLHLGGTPLNHTIVSAFEIIPDFKKENKLQIVNSVFLTDGESSIIGERFSFVDYRSNQIISKNEARPGYKHRSIFRDTITKATEELNYCGNYGGSSTSETTALLKLLKQRTECNLIGIFVGSSRDIRSTIDLYGEKRLCQYSERIAYVEQRLVSFKKDKHLTLENCGYDEYYLIGSTSLEIEDKELVIKESATTRGIATAFSKYTGGKVNSRIILNRFIKLIT